MELPRGGLIGRSVRLYRKVRQMHISTHAASAGYFIVMAVFPALVLVLSILRYTRFDAGDVLALMSGYVPAPLMDVAQKLVVSTYANASTTVVSVSAIGALWSASRGVYGVLAGLNAIYGVREERGYWHKRGISVFYTCLLLLLLVLTLVLNVFGEALFNSLLGADSQLRRLIMGLVDLRFLLLMVLQTSLFTAMFMVMPTRKNTFSDSLPGALLASAGWLIFTQLFSLYVDNVRGYSSLYGSVYTVALSMLWLYCCLSILFYGGALNRLLSEREENMENL